MMIRRCTLSVAVILLAALGASDGVAVSARQRDRTGRPGPTVRPGPGSTTTRLPDGRLLVMGGEGSEAAAWLWSSDQQAATLTPGRPQSPRAWHSATLLSDGTVLLAGGRNSNVLVEVPEIFNPATGVFTPTAIVGAVPRAGHTATLLIDGRVLVVGGANGGVSPLATELWDVNAHTAEGVGTGVGRSGHTATLTADGQVLISGGNGLDGKPSSNAVALEPLTGAVQVPAATQPSPDPIVVASLPEAGATGVPVDAHVALRFSDAMSVASLSNDTVTLSGPDGLVPTRIVAAEDGRLAFVWPTDHLRDDTIYVLQVAGAVDRAGAPVVPASIAFTTIGSSEPTADGEVWMPDARNGWRANRPDSPWRQLAPLEAPPGVTAIAGQTLRLDGQPLADVTIAAGRHTTRTDRTGRFLLQLDRASAGHVALFVDGRMANRRGATYGSYEIGVPIVAGRTTALPYTIWTPVLDTAHAVRIPSPTQNEVVVSTPLIPGLELRLPPQTVIRDHDGKIVTSISITPVPLDRPPFPLPAGVQVPIYFTTQPGGASLSVLGSAGPGGARLIYPNGLHMSPGSTMDFWRYEPDGAGWEVYGRGRVTPNGQQVVPDPGVEVYEFTGAMVAGPNYAPGNGPKPGNPAGKDGDPVDLGTGLFVLQKTDLALRDVIPLALTRTYRQADARSRAFGIGATHPYDMFFVGSTNPWTYIDLILADGGRIHYDRISPGTSYADAVFEHTATPTAWYKSTIQLDASGTAWALTRRDGTVWTFRDGFNATKPAQAGLMRIQDRFGNVVTLTRDANYNLTKITSPSGRWMTLSYDASDRVTQVQDNAGRTVGYTYDASGRLWKVTDPAGGVTEYTYDASHRMLTLKDPRGIVYLTNAYDANDRVVQQTQADSGTFQFAYTVDGGGNVTQADVTNPRGYVRRVTFNADGYAASVVEAVGTAVERTTTFTRQTGSNFITSTTDGLDRRTDFTYDTTGHVLTTTQLGGTANALTTTYTYEPTFGQLAMVTDPLSHTWTTTYDASGVLTGMTDPLSHHTTIAMNSNGQVTSVTDPLTHQWLWGYTGGDLTSATDPLAAVRTQFVDAAGRLVSTTDSLGHVTQTVYDNLNRTTSVTDAMGGQTTFTYDGNSNLLSLTDALRHTTSYTYDTGDRVAMRTDPLSHASSFQYDLNGNPTQTTDRKSQVTSSTYDALDRLSQVTFDDSSTISYMYDAGDRITQINDSSNGTIDRTYDLLDRLTEETTPQGTIDYTYDAAGRRTSMTVMGQTAAAYGYDDANRLTSITQGSATVSITYDNANRRSTLTYPNGIVATFGYDNANHLTSLTYTLGATTLGDLTYTYDAAGRRTSMAGSWARTGIPAALGSATYDAANRIATWDSSNFTHDLNGNLTSDGTTAYVWNARNQLTGLSGGSSASFAYDAFRRRRGKTISGTTTNFLYDRSNFVQEQTGGGVPTANLLTGLRVDETFTRTDGTGTATTLPDALGSTLALADNAGTLQTQYTYAAFGATSASGAASSNAAQFTGREDDGAGLYFYRGRYYSPVLQRFISEDSYGFAGGDVNLYAYVANRPVSYRDPSGHFAALVLPVAGCLGGMAGAWAGNAMGGRKTTWPDLASGCGVGIGIGLGAAAAGWGAAAGAADAAAGAGAAAEAEAAETATTTVVHYTNEAGARAISESGFLQEGTYVTLPQEVAGLTQSEIEEALEIAQGKGAVPITVDVPTSSLTVPPGGPVTSGGV
jgi:RHS repeat-associated protein